MIHKRTLHSLEYDRILDRLAALCRSETGRERALATLPLPDEEAVREAQALYGEAEAWAGHPATLSLGTQASRGGPGAFPSVQGLLNAVEQKGPGAVSWDLEAFWALRGVLLLARDMRDSICTPEGERHWPRLMGLATNPPLPNQLTAALLRCISDDGNIRDESTPELYQVRVEIRSLHQTCLRRVRTFCEEHNILQFLQDEFMTLSSDRYVLPFKASYKNKMQGIIHDWSQTGETCYFEPMFLVDLNNRIQELKREEREREHEVLEFLAGLLQTELAGARAALRLLTELDYLEAKRRLAAVLHGRCIPLDSPEHGIGLVQVRHPLLLVSELEKLGRDPNIRRQEEREKRAFQKVHPLDIEFRPGEKALIVTGGNAGGKTVCLKSLGLCAAMTLAALPVPAEPGSHLPWFSRIDAFIGDEQSLADNVSTFTAQIDHLAKAWRHLGDDGLVLLDEFGSGTDPAQGSALAQALLDELVKKGTYVLAATHFPALKSYALTRDKARAASMLFSPETRKPLFALAYDQVGASQALDVAREHGLPEAIIAGAERYLLQDGQDATSLLHKLNDLAAARAEEIRLLKAEQQKAQASAQRWKERLEQDRLKLYGEVRAKAQELMQAWKEDRATHRQALREMSALRASLAREGMADEGGPASVLPAPQAIQAGDTVLHAVFRKKGTVTEVDEKRGRVRLDLGGVFLWADMKDVRESGAKQAAGGQAAGRTEPQAPQAKVFGRIAAAAGGAKAQEESAGAQDGRGQSARHSAGAAFRIDVRGMRAEQAIASLQACLDKAYLAELGDVEVVHGKGTGALRRAIHEWLGSCSQVAAFALAPADRGGDGMTIVTLK